MNLGPLYTYRRPWTRVGLTERANLKLKAKWQGHSYENVKIVFFRAFTLGQDQKIKTQPILHIIQYISLA